VSEVSYKALGDDEAQYLYQQLVARSVDV